MMRRGLRAAAIAVLCIATVLGLYALKNRAGINLFGNFSLSDHAPFSYLRASNVIIAQPGMVLVDESFNARFVPHWQWSGELAAGSGRFEPEYELAGPDGSRCVVIRSAKPTWWNLSHRFDVAVEVGQELHVTATVWDGSERGRAEIQVASYDEQRRVISWEQWRQASTGKHRFEQLDLNFTIPQGVRFVRMRLAGWGQGEFRFDDVKFWRDI